jgi:hypothetical protein
MSLKYIITFTLKCILMKSMTIMIIAINNNIANRSLLPRRGKAVKVL